MNTPLVCPRCHAPLPADAPRAALCPSCLIELAELAALAPSLPEPDAPTLTFGSATTLDAPPARVAAVAMQPFRSFSAGERLAPYRLVAPLGRGGFGEVWEAEDERDGRRVALKLLSERFDRDARERFRREGKILASIQHPRVVFVFAAEELDGVPAIAMELLGGGTLDELVKRSGPLPWRDAVARILELADGLEAAHAKGILHRDIKPSNAFLDDLGEARIGDFGLSVPTERGAHASLAEGYVGTPAFSSPEQVRGVRLDLRSDLFSLGATLYYLLSGRFPFGEGSVGQILARVVDEEPAPLDSNAIGLPPGLERVVRRLMAKEPGARYADYRALRSALLPYTARRLGAARLALRFGVHFVDSLFVTTLVFGARAATSGSWSALAERPSALGVALSLAISAAYYFLFELRFARTPGKALAGLAVRAADGAPAGGRALLLRTAFFLGLTAWLPGLLNLAIGEQPAPSSTFALLLAALLLALMALPFASARARNGYRGFHELASGTRVVVEPLLGSRRRLGPDDARAAPAPDLSLAPERSLPAQLGPFRLLGTLSRTSECELLAAFDPQLERRVWIERGLDGAEQGSVPSEGDLRIALPRLQSGSVDGLPWSAYASPSGRPLLAHLDSQSPLELRSVRRLLSAAAHTLAQAEAAKMPLSLDRLWQTDDGRLLALPFPATRVVRFPAVELDRFADAATVLPSNLLLHQISFLLLERRLVPATELGAAQLPAAPLPAGDRAIVERIASHRAGSAAEIAEMLALREGRRVAVGRLARSVALLFSGLPVHLNIVVGLTRFFGSPVLDRESFYLLGRQLLFLSTPLLWVSAVGGLLGALALRSGGLSFALSKLAVVRANGGQATAMRRLARAAVVAAPALLLLIDFGLSRSGINPMAWLPWVGARRLVNALPILIWAAGGVYAALHPTRGLQDRIAGTALVPR